MVAQCSLVDKCKPFRGYYFCWVIKSYLSHFYELGGFKLFNLRLYLCELQLFLKTCFPYHHVSQGSNKSMYTLGNVLDLLWIHSRYTGICGEM